MADKFSIDDSTYYDLANELSVPAAAIRAVAEVESNGNGFLPDGRVSILFEAQVFGKLTGYVYNASHPNISSSTWNRSLYKGGAGEWTRLEEACQLNEDAAYQSTSWGMFQIVGFNYAACGYPNARAMGDTMAISATNQSIAFANFIRSNPRMAQALRNQDWNTFAFLYNGPGQVAVYSAKIAQSYSKWSQVFVNQPNPSAINVLSPDALVATENNIGPTIPPVDTATPPQPILKSKTVLAGGAAVVTTGASVADQITNAFSNIQQTSDTTTGMINSISNLSVMLGGTLILKIVPILLGLIAIGVMVYMLYQHIKRSRTGQPLD